MGLLRHRWDEPGITGRTDGDGWNHYDGKQFHGVQRVRAALDDAPERFVDLDDPDITPTGREDFLGAIGVATADGKRWDVWLSDDHLGALVDAEDDSDDDDSDLVTAHLERQDWVRSAAHPDTEAFEVTSVRRVSVSEVVAAVYRAVSAAHVELRDRQQS